MPPTRLRPEQVRRTLALVVDDLGLSFESTAQVRVALKKFVDEQMQPGDMVAIVRAGAGMGAMQQLSADKRQLYAALASPFGSGGIHPRLAGLFANAQRMARSCSPCRTLTGTT